MIGQGGDLRRWVLGALDDSIETGQLRAAIAGAQLKRWLVRGASERLTIEKASGGVIVDCQVAQLTDDGRTFAGMILHGRIEDVQDVVNQLAPVLNAVAGLLSVRVLATGSNGWHLVATGRLTADGETELSSPDAPVPAAEPTGWPDTVLERPRWTRLSRVGSSLSGFERDRWLGPLRSCQHLMSASPVFSRLATGQFANLQGRTNSAAVALTSGGLTVLVSWDDGSPPSSVHFVPFDELRDFTQHEGFLTGEFDIDAGDRGFTVGMMKKGNSSPFAREVAEVRALLAEYPPTSAATSPAEPDEPGTSGSPVLAVQVAVRGPASVADAARPSSAQAEAPEPATSDDGPAVPDSPMAVQHWADRGSRPDDGGRRRRGLLLAGAVGAILFVVIALATRNGDETLTTEPNPADDILFVDQEADLEEGVDDVPATPQPSPTTTAAVSAPESTTTSPRSTTAASAPESTTTSPSSTTASAADAAAGPTAAAALANTTYGSPEVSEPSGSVYSVVVAFSNDTTTIGAEVAEVEYPELSCSGGWTLDAIESDRLVLTERITSGVNRCVETGTVTLTPLGNATLQFDWGDGRAVAELTEQPTGPGGALAQAFDAVAGCSWSGTFEQGSRSYSMNVTITEVNEDGSFGGTAFWPDLGATKTELEGRVVSPGDDPRRWEQLGVDLATPNLTWLRWANVRYLEGSAVQLNAPRYAVLRDDGSIEGIWFWDAADVEHDDRFTLQPVDC